MHKNDRLALVMDSHKGWQAANPFSRETRTAVRMCPLQATSFDQDGAHPDRFVQILPHKALPSLECYIEEFVNVTVEVRLHRECKGRRALDFTMDLDAQAPVQAGAPVQADVAVEADVAVQGSVVDLSLD